MNNGSLVDTLYRWVVKRRNPLVLVFQVFFVLQTLVLFFGSWAVYSQSIYVQFFYDVGNKSGEIAIIFFILASIPGIVRRFRKFNKLVSILMIFRRYIGIATYLFVISHASFVYISPLLARQFPLFPIPIFILFGFLAHVMLFLLFITSNDLSVKKLGVWWHNIHNLMYFIVWVIFVHVALQGFSIWATLIGVTAVMQIASFWYARKLREGNKETAI
jgi:methionine sulfoxide reductase heme-binding subunit